MELTTSSCVGDVMYLRKRRKLLPQQKSIALNILRKKMVELTEASEQTSVQADKDLILDYRAELNRELMLIEQIDASRWKL